MLGYPAQPDFSKGRDSWRWFVVVYKMLGHYIPWTHVYCMVTEAWKTRDVRLTFKIVQSRSKAFFLMYPPNSVEKIMSKHAQVGIFCSNENTALKCFPVF